MAACAMAKPCLPLERLPISERTRIFRLPGSERVLGIISPIYNEPSCWQSDCHAHEPTQQVLGVLDISMSLDDVDRDMQSSQRRLLLFGIVAIAAVSAMIRAGSAPVLATAATPLAEIAATEALGPTKSSRDEPRAK